jgi:thiaminase
MIKKNLDLWMEYINNSFCNAMADGTASLDGFRYYMIVCRFGHLYVSNYVTDLFFILARPILPQELRPYAAWSL